MEILKTDHYDRFRCLAAACPDSCCHEWEVDIDEETAARYYALEGELGERLRQVLYTNDGETCMRIEEGRCPMWRQDGLCRIQAELGHDALSFVCRTFPRLRQDYGDFAELSLEMSCPEAARLILQTPWEVTSHTEAGGEADYDEEAMEILKAGRGVAEEYLRTTDAPIGEALSALLLYAYEVQAWLDGGEAPEFDPEANIRDARKYAAEGDEEGFLAFFAGLEILTDRWRQRLQTPLQSPWTETYRQLARYFVRRYWLQAVWDYDLVCRVKLGICGCLLIRLLGGDTTQTAQLFSKEIENDPDNLEAILDGAYHAPALTDVNLLSLLLKN